MLNGEVPLAYNLRYSALAAQQQFHKKIHNGSVRKLSSELTLAHCCLSPVLLRFCFRANLTDLLIFLSQVTLRKPAVSLGVTKLQRRETNAKLFEDLTNSFSQLKSRKVTFS